MARMEVDNRRASKQGSNFDVLVKAIHEGSGGKRRPFDGFERPPEDYDDTEYTFYLELMAPKTFGWRTRSAVQLRVPTTTRQPNRSPDDRRPQPRLGQEAQDEIIGEIQQQISNVDLKVDG